MPTSTPAAESFEALLREHDRAHPSQASLKPGTVITAEIVGIERERVILSAGLKSESWLPIEEFLDEAGKLEAQVGDFVPVSLESLDNGYGDVALSRQKAKIMSAWAELEAASQSGASVFGKASGKVKGGLSVMIKGIRAFLPGSLSGLPTKDVTPLMDQVIEVKVAKIDRARNNVVLSRRELVEGSEGSRQKTLETLQEGQIVEGTVKNLADYGAFIDIGGADGLAHVSDISWKRLRHPSEALAIGQKVTAKVIKIDREKGRISLGLKQLGDDPWAHLSRRYPPGARLFGKVTNIADYGVFIELEPGVEGLAHTSELEWSNRNPIPSKLFSVGQEVEFMVLSIDDEKRRASLGIKQCQPNPWSSFADAHQVGDKVSGQVKSITDFGAFVTLAPGVEGLARFADAERRLPGVSRDTQKGSELSLFIQEIDIERERITLSPEAPSAQAQQSSAPKSTAMGAALLQARSASQG